MAKTKTTAHTLAAEDSGPHLLTVGRRIRNRRQQLKLTLKELSLRAEVPLSTLSKVETGRMSLNIQKLVNVCSALGIDVMQLVSPEQTGNSAQTGVTGRRSITRHQDERCVQTEKATYKHHANDFSNRKLIPMVVEVHAELDPELIRHQGEEFIYILEGEVEVLTEFYEPATLRAGESIYIDSTMGHNVRAKGGHPAKILSIMTGDGLTEGHPASSD